MMPYALARGVGTSYSVIAPVTGSSRPMRFPRCSVNQILPSGPWAGVGGPGPACGRGYSVNRPVLGSNAAILLPPCSVMYIRPSEAQAIPWGRDSGVGMSHSVNFSVFGSKRPSLFAPISTNQIAPSGAATRQCGAEFGVGMSYSVNSPAGRPAPRAPRKSVLPATPKTAYRAPRIMSSSLRNQAGHVVDQQGRVARILRPEGVQPAVDRPEGRRVDPCGHRDAGYERRTGRIGEVVEIEAGPRPPFRAEHQQLPVGTDLQIAHGVDVRRDDRIHQDRGAGAVQLPDLHGVAGVARAEIPCPSVGVSVCHPEIGAVALRNVVATRGDAQMAARHPQLPEPAHHVHGIERPVVELHPPDVGVSRSSGDNGVDAARR